MLSVLAAKTDGIRDIMEILTKANSKPQPKQAAHSVAATSNLLKVGGSESAPVKAVNRSNSCRASQPINRFDFVGVAG